MLTHSTSANTPTQDPTDTPGRPAVQRLGSLNASRSASPAVRRGAPTRGKKGPIKPTFSGRRSKEERAALEKEAIEREKARNAERQKRDENAQKRLEANKKREASRAQRGRGGYSGAMSGPFSMGSSRDDRKANHRTASTFGSGSGSRATRIKDEDGGMGGSGGGGGGGGGGSSGYRLSGGPSTHRDHGGLDSSEDEEDAVFPRKDIDLIEISSDEGEAQSTYRPSRTTLPVRIGRKEHLERAFGINTDASTETSAKILEQAEATGQAPTASGLKHASSKGKGKARQTDAGPTTKAFKGVWQDSDELASPVKTEDDSNDETMLDAQQIGLAARAAEEITLTEPETRARPRFRNHPEPVLQTDQDRAEWTRYQSNLSHVRAELGPNVNEQPDATGDVPMADGARKPTVRDNNVYLFQIPPLMPELLLPGSRKDNTSAPSSDHQQPPPPTIKQEPTDTSNPTPHTAPRFASGLVGKLRVRQSGRTTLDWGGTSYELAPGNKASFLQEVVSLTLVEERERVVPEDAGEAVSFGRVKGKFVVVPDWEGMLG